MQPQQTAGTLPSQSVITTRSVTVSKRGKVIEGILRALWPSDQYDGHLQYLSEQALATACSNAHIQRLVQWVLNRLPFLPAHSREKIELVLNLLSTRLGTFLLVGFRCFTRRFPFMTAFWDLPLRRIERILVLWLTHRIPLLRLLGRGLKGLCLQAIVSMPGVEQPGLNEWSPPTLAVMGYTARPPPRPLKPPESAKELAIQSCLLSLKAPATCEYACSGLEEMLARLQSRGLKAIVADKAKYSDVEWLPNSWSKCLLNSNLPPERRQKLRSNGTGIDAIVEADVLVVGSGAGGGVTASVLAEAGFQVLVVEKGGYMHPDDVPRADDDAIMATYEHGMLTSTTDSGISVLAGSGIGGGTRINWCACFRTPPHVRSEWAVEHGLTFADSPRYTRALDVICDKLAVHTHPRFEADKSAVALQAAMNKQGEHVGTIPQNCVKPEQCVKHCCFGCVSGGKRDTASAFVAPAVATGNLTILTHASAHKIIMESSCVTPTPHTPEATAAATAAPKATAADAEQPLLKPDAPKEESIVDGEDSHARKRRAVGAIIRLEGEGKAAVTIAVKARAVVAAAGTLHSPALLLRSGVRCRGNVGKHLRLHPATFVIGCSPPEPSSTSGVQETPKLLSQLLSAPQMPLYSRAAANWPPLPDPSGKPHCDSPVAMNAPHACGDHSGYGTFLSTGPPVPIIVAAGLPYQGRECMQRDVHGMQSMLHILQYTRDDGPGGRVKLNRKGEPELFYKLSKSTKQHVLDGMLLSLRTLRAAGSQRVLTLHDSYTEFTDITPQQRDSSKASSHDPHSIPQDHAFTSGQGTVNDTTDNTDNADFSFVSREVATGGSRQEDAQALAAAADVRFEEWLKGVQAKGAGAHRVQLFSAHQLGTCRMGADRKTSVVDTRGECWDVQGLWVADASLLPTATGVNPMVTTEAMALCVAETLASELLGNSFQLVPRDFELCSRNFEW